MKKRAVGFPVVAGAALAVLAVASFSLTCILSARDDLGGGEGASMLSRLLGESRRAIGATMTVEADRYFHRGVPHQNELAFVDFIQRLKDEVQPRDHVHLSDTETFEMMPWLRFATRMDPRNVDAYLGAAFWAAEQRGYEGQALEILDEARRNNPGDYRIPLQCGMIYLRYGDITGATRAFEKGLRLWPRAEGVSEAQKQQDLASLLNYRGFLYELKGRDGMALTCYRKAQRLRPDSHGLDEIIRGIEGGYRTDEDIERSLQVFLRSSAEMYECSRHEGEHGHGEDAHPHSDDSHEHR